MSRGLDYNSEVIHLYVVTSLILYLVNDNINNY